MTHSTRVTFEHQGLTLVADRWQASADQPRRGLVLLLHGGGQTRHSWHRSGHRFARVGWDTYALDARGHGESSWADDADYSLDALVGDLLAVVAQLGERPVLIGASMGGMTSLLAEAEQGPMSRALVLVDIAPRAEPEGIRRIHAFMSAHLDGFDTLDQVREAIAAYNPARAGRTTADGVRKNVRQRNDGRWYWHWDPRLLGPPDRSAFARNALRMERAAAKLVGPVLLVRGASSDVLSAEGAADFQRLAPHAHLADVRAGHMVAGDDNDVFASQVSAFLAAEVP